MPEPADRLSTALTDRYRIERELGRGGMATVYLAEDVKHHRPVAIKVLHPELSAVLGTERFLKEIELTASLQHPHILPLFDSGVADGLLYYVMPYVEGETLRARLDRERQLPVADAVRIAQDVAGALEYAHKRGVIHRDIKPENVLLHDGRPLVADFGIALAVQEAGGQRMTQTGLSLGTPQYMAPEQAMGEKTVDARADVFALGAVTYEMLAGEAPFTGPTLQAVVAKVLTAMPAPLTDLRKSVPAHVAAAVAAALEKLPADRPASAAVFAAALGDATARTLAAPVPGPTAIGVRSMPWLLGGALGALLGIGAITMIGPPGSRRTTEPVRFTFTPPDSVTLQSVCCGQMMDLSPDGRLLVFQGSRETGDSASRQFQLWLRDLGDLSVRGLAGTDGATSLSFSPDGRQVAFVTSRRLMRVPVAGTAPIMVSELPAGYVGGTTWAGRDRIIVAVQSTLYEVSTTSGERRILLPADSLDRQVTGPSWVPEGNGVLFAYGSLDDLPVVHWLPAGSAVSRPLMMGATPRYVPTWKSLIIARMGQLTAYGWDPASGDTTGAGRQVGGDVAMRSPILAHAEYAVSLGGSLVMGHRRSSSASGLTAVEGGVPRDIALSATGDLVVDNVSFAPDGRRFALDARATRESSSLRSIYTWDVARAVAQRVTDQGDARLPAWTEGSDSVVFRTGKGGTFMIRAADGSGESRTLFDVEGWRVPVTSLPSVSMRGPWLAFTGVAPTGSASSDIGVAHRDSGGRVRTYVSTPAEETAPAISPDGKWLAYVSNETGSDEVYVSPFPDPTSRVTVTRGGGRQPKWSGDGHTLYFESSGTGAIEAVAFTAGPAPSIGAPRLVYRRGYVRSWAISPDGTLMLFIDSLRLESLLGFEIVLNLRP